MYKLLHPKNISCLLISFLILHVTNNPRISKSAELPKVLQIKDDKKIVFASVGQFFSLKCPVKDRRAYVDWMKGNESLYLEDDYSMSDTGAVLKIKNVTSKHGGTYTCHVINGHGAVSINFTVIINTPKQEKVLKYNHTLQEVEALPSEKGTSPMIENTVETKFKEETGASIAMHCKSSGYPPPHIFWIKDGKRINGNTASIVNNSTRSRTESTLVLRKLKKSDAGVFSCIAKNHAGEDELIFTLSVTDPLHPPEIISINPRYSTVLHGHTVVFRCKGKNVPGVKLHIKWMKTITEHEKGQWQRTFRLGSKYYRVLDTDEDPIMANDGRFQSELLISNATVTDSGAYVCLAVSDKGYEFKDASLEVIYPAMPSSHVQPSMNDSTIIISVISASVLFALFTTLFFYCLCCKSVKKESQEFSGSTMSATADTREIKKKTIRAQLIV